MRTTFLILIFQLTGFLITLNIAGCSSSISHVTLSQDYHFSEKQKITIYVIPSGNIERDGTYSRILHLDFQARGYEVINANDLIKKNSDKISITNHRQVADSLQSRKYLPSSDLYVVVSPVWDSAFVLKFYSEDRYIYWIEYQFAGMNVPTLTSQVSIYDRSLRDPVKSYVASDTTYVLSENNNSQWVYPEYQWMVIAKQLSRELEDIPICSIVNKTKAKNQFNVSYWVDKSYREAFPDSWIDRLKLRTLYANDILRTQLDIEISHLEFVEWNASFNKSLDNSLEKLYQTTTPNPGTLKIGITFNEELKRNWTDKSELGFAYLLSNEAVITAQPSYPSVGQYWNSIEEAITLVHEIGHVLGAIHIPDENSIMYPSAGLLSYEFDEVNKKIITATKTNFLMQDAKERLISYSEALAKTKDYPSQNANPILPAITSVIQQIDNRSQIITDNSEKTFGNLSKLLPDSAITLAVMGYVEYKDNDYKKAENHFTHALEIDPDFAEAQYYLSFVLRKNGDTKQADEYKNLAKPYANLWIIDR
jgi:tetratricopeptide (TPR) repeat protein